MGETIDFQNIHDELLNWIKKNKSKQIAQDFDKKCDEIKRNRGITEVMKFQINKAKEYGLSLVLPSTTILSIEAEGNNVMLIVGKMEPLQETEEE